MICSKRTMTRICKKDVWQRMRREKHSCTGLGAPHTLSRWDQMLWNAVISQNEKWWKMNDTADIRRGCRPLALGRPLLAWDANYTKAKNFAKMRPILFGKPSVLLNDWNVIWKSSVLANVKTKCVRWFLQSGRLSLNCSDKMGDTPGEQWTHQRGAREVRGHARVL